MAPQEELEFSFGVDPSVKVNYKPLVKVDKTPKVVKQARIVSHEQAIEIENLHTYPVNVMVKDNLPHSQNENIKVINKWFLLLFDFVLKVCKQTVKLG